MHKAEREGFEPSVDLRPHRFSRPARSAAPAPLRKGPARGSGPCKEIYVKTGGPARETDCVSSSRCSRRCRRPEKAGRHFLQNSQTVYSRDSPVGHEPACGARRCGEPGTCGAGCQPAKTSAGQRPAPHPPVAYAPGSPVVLKWRDQLRSLIRRWRRCGRPHGQRSRLARYRRRNGHRRCDYRR
jgi:hypothetical protein